MKKWIVKLLLGWLEKDAPAWYNGIKDDKRRDWLFSQYEDEGMREYFKWRDITILKSLGAGAEGKHYWMLVGQRIELLKMIGYAKEEFEKEKKRKDRRDKKEKDNETE